MAYIRLPGKSGRYLNTETGESISRRQKEKLEKPEMVKEREQRYKARLKKRKTISKKFPFRKENYEYLLQRYSEQYAVAHDMDDEEAKILARKPGSRFNRLYSEAELQEFRGGADSAWDMLLRLAGATGDDGTPERNVYDAILGWYARHTKLARQRWMERDKHGKFIRHWNVANNAA